MNKCILGKKMEVSAIGLGCMGMTATGKILELPTLN